MSFFDKSSGLVARIINSIRSRLTRAVVPFPDVSFTSIVSAISAPSVL